MSAPLAALEADCAAWLAVFPAVSAAFPRLLAAPRAAPSTDFAAPLAVLSTVLATPFAAPFAAFPAPSNHSEISLLPNMSDKSISDHCF